MENNLPDSSDTISSGRRLIQDEIRNICHYVQHVVVVHTGDEKYSALIFPNQKLLNQPDYKKTPEEGCFCPRDLNEIGKCISGCIGALNKSMELEQAKIVSALLVNAGLSTEDGTLMENMQENETVILERYHAHLQNLSGANEPLPEEVFYMRFTS